MNRWRVIVTRPLEHADRLAATLIPLGIEPVAVPAISFEPPLAYAPLDGAIHHLDRYQWIVFTSRTGVRVFFERVGAQHGRIPIRLRWGTVGPGTAEALRDHHVEHVWMPSRWVSEALADEIPAQRGERVLRIQGEAASPMLSERLRSRGIEVDDCVAYRTVEAPSESVPLLRNAFLSDVHGVIFSSASAVRGFSRLIEEAGLKVEGSPLVFIAIGPVTADAVRGLGWQVDLVADEHSVKGIAGVLQRRESDATGVA